MLLQALALLPEVDEDRDLRAEDVRVEGLEDVVDGAGRIAAEDVPLVLRDRRQEDDRDRRRARAALDQLGRLEAVHVRHLDVEQDAREVAVEQLAQRGLSGLHGDELLVERLERRLERQQVLGAIVDEEDAGVIHDTHACTSDAAQHSP